VDPTAEIASLMHNNSSLIPTNPSHRTRLQSRGTVNLAPGTSHTRQDARVTSTRKTDDSTCANRHAAITCTLGYKGAAPDRFIRLADEISLTQSTHQLPPAKVNAFYHPGRTIFSGILIPGESFDRLCANLGWPGDFLLIDWLKITTRPKRIASGPIKNKGQFYTAP